MASSDDLHGHGHALPGDRRSWPRDRLVDTRHIRLDVRLHPEERAVSGTATHHVNPLSDGLASVLFDAVAFEITGVTVDRRSAAYDYDGTTLSVRLEPPGRRDAERRVAISYRATPRVGLYFTGPDEAYPDKPVQAWTQGQDDDSRHWFPCVDAPAGRQTTEVLATVPAAWKVLSNGRLLEDRVLRGGLHRVHWFQERPHPVYLVSLVAGEFSRVDQSRDGLTIDYYVEERHREAGERAFGRTPEMVALFGRLLDFAYPWHKYSQVVVRDFVFGGMENTTATTMTEGLLLDERAALDSEPDGLVSHELAHQWFGDLVTCRDWDHGWLNEGFATYFEMLWDEHRLGVDGYRQGALENTRRYLGERYRRPLVSNVWRAPIDVFDRHLYEKGALVLHSLRSLLGDDAFFRALRRYLRENQDRSVVTQHLVDAIAAETGRELDWFFHQWVFSPGHPRLKVGWSWEEARRLATVTVEQTQESKDGTPEVFRLPLTVEFRVGRRYRSFPVEVRERRQVLVFPLPSRPAFVRFDPGQTFTRELEFERPTAELIAQLGGDDDVAGRAGAAEALGRKGGPGAVEALARVLLRDRWWGVQAAAAAALGTLRTNAARDALVAAVRVREPRARRAVMAALGEFREDAAACRALLVPAAQDRSYFVQAEALHSLGKTRLGEAFVPLISGLARPSHRDVVRSGAIEGLVELRDERAIKPIADACAYGEPPWARRTAVAALGTLGEHLPERATELADRLVSFLHDPDFRVRVAAARALRTIGEPGHATALDAMAERELDGRAVRAARESALALRKENGGEALGGLRDDLEKLRADNARLRERVEALEALTKRGE